MGWRAVKVFLDTHAAVFLWEGRIEVFGRGAKELLETASLRISPIVRLELQYLHEIQRIVVEPDRILGGLEADCGVLLSDDTLTAVVSRAMGLTWTRDPFDRLIVATAMLHDAPLVTRDRIISENFAKVVWK